MKDNYKKIFNRKKVLITGHTGFKGSWLALWMHHLGANVMGISKIFRQILLILIPWD